MLEATLRSPPLKQQRILRIWLLCFKVARAPPYKSPRESTEFYVSRGSSPSICLSAIRLPLAHPRRQESTSTYGCQGYVQQYFNIAASIKLMTLAELQAAQLHEDSRTSQLRDSRRSAEKLADELQVDQRNFPRSPADVTEQQQIDVPRCVRSQRQFPRGQFCRARRTTGSSTGVSSRALRNRSFNEGKREFPRDQAILSLHFAEEFPLAMPSFGMYGDSVGFQQALQAPAVHRTPLQRSSVIESSKFASSRRSR